MPSVRKIDSETFNLTDESEICAKKKTPPVIKVYRGDVLTKLELRDIPANTYEWLVFIPCDIVGDHSWPSIFASRTIISLNNQRYARDKVMNSYDVHELDARGLLFAFPAV